MEENLEGMNQALEEKRNRFDNDESLKFNENYGKIVENMEKQKVIMADCHRFFILLQQQDEHDDKEQAANNSITANKKRKYTENNNGLRIQMEDKPKNNFNEIRIERRPLTSEEEKYLERWDKYSQEMDEILNEISKELEAMLNRLEFIHEEQQKNQESAEKLGDQVKNLKQDVELNNKYLKKVATELRSPGKICADISLGLVLSMLIGVLVYVIRLYMSLE